jgi:hypothetical protein
VPSTRLLLDFHGKRAESEMPSNVACTRC